MADVTRDEFDAACNLVRECLGFRSPAWVQNNSDKKKGGHQCPISGKCGIVLGGQGVVFLPDVDCFSKRHPVVCRVWPDFSRKIQN